MQKSTKYTQTIAESEKVRAAGGGEAGIDTAGVSGDY